LQTPCVPCIHSSCYRTPLFLTARLMPWHIFIGFLPPVHRPQKSQTCRVFLPSLLDRGALNSCFTFLPHCFFVLFQNASLEPFCPGTSLEKSMPFSLFGRLVCGPDYKGKPPFPLSGRSWLLFLASTLCARRPKRGRSDCWRDRLPFQKIF